MQYGILPLKLLIQLERILDIQNVIKKVALKILDFKFVELNARS
jgi:hypothetical protein